nr:GA-binding protein subunit beta-1-like [Halyomorpha halys]
MERSSLNDIRALFGKVGQLVIKQRSGVIKALLVTQETISLINKNKRPLLHTAAREGRTAVVRTLLAQKINPNLRGAVECTALQEAAAKGRMGVMHILLRHGADVMAKTVTGQTALHWAADVSHCNAVMLLLQAGAEDCPTIFGLTGEYIAVSHGHEEITVLLRHFRGI